MNRDDVAAALKRRLQHEEGQPAAFPSFDNVLERLSTEKLTIYLGIDPTGSQVHIGHSVPILLLKDLASFGHDIILLIGDFTARIGDPTDKSAARAALSEKEVKENYKNYLKQVERLIPKRTFHVRYNSSWLQKMNLEKVLELTGQVSVQQMMARDMFQKRKSDEKPIYVSEFLYPLMQGYDSVAMDVDGEAGGNDQTFNMLVGRDLLKTYADKEKIVLPTRLLVDASSGKKLSKTEGGFIALDDEPSVIFEKVSRTIPDDMIRTVFELCTELPMKEIQERHTQAEESGDWRDYNLSLAYELVSMYYDEDEAEKAKERYLAAVSGDAVEDAEAVKIDADKETPMTRVLAQALDISRSEAKRLIEQKAVTRNGKLVTDALGESDITTGDVLRVGSHRPFRVTVNKNG